MSTTKPRGAVGATLTGIVNSLRGGDKVSLLPADFQMEGTNVLITGANSGLGLATATDLAARGCRVFMAVRGDNDEPRRRVVAASGNDAVVRLPLDLASFSSVNAFLKKAVLEDLKFQVIILNAAVVTAGAQRTEDGFDEMLQVNFLSNVLLVEGLLRQGRIASADPESLPRVVIVNSEAHRWVESVDLSDFGVFRAFPMGKVLAHYSYTKFLSAAYAGSLSRRLCQADGTPSVSVFALCPGAINSRLARNAPAFLKPLLGAVFSLFFASPKKAARPVVYLAASPIPAGKTGQYLHMRTEKEMDARALDPAFAEELMTAVQTALSQAVQGDLFFKGAK